MTDTAMVQSWELPSADMTAQTMVGLKEQQSDKCLVVLMALHWDRQQVDCLAYQTAGHWVENSAHTLETSSVVLLV